MCFCKQNTAYDIRNSEWSSDVCSSDLHAEEFAAETIFVICNSGMKHTIARKIFDKCMAAIANGVSCATVFGHKGKSAAMAPIWSNRTQLFADYLAAPDTIQYFRSIHWIGYLTCYPLPKNFGPPYPQPAVHLVPF